MSTFTPRTVELVTALAEEGAPLEVCGLIGVKLLSLEPDAQKVYPCRNIHENPEREFLVDNRDQFAALRKMEGRGETFVGVYHSHPVGRPWPSERDLEYAELLGPTITQLLYSLQDHQALEFAVDADLEFCELGFWCRTGDGSWALTPPRSAADAA